MARRGRQSRQLWLSRAVLGLLLAGSVVTVAVWQSAGTPPARAENLQDSSVWLLSAKASDGVLVDGASAAVIRRVVLQPRPVSVVQPLLRRMVYLLMCLILHSMAGILMTSKSWWGKVPRQTI